MRFIVSALILGFALPVFAGNTGDMFGDRGYVPASYWSPPLHDRADMFAHDYTYVGSTAELFGHVQAPGSFGVEQMFTPHAMPPTPDTPIYHRPDLPYMQ